MHLFYSTNISENTITLDNEESKHLAKVLRLEMGDNVLVIDGKGSRYFCSIHLAHQKASQLTIIEKEVVNEFYGIEIAAAPTKNLNRWEWFLEKTTEIGIDAIHPIVSFHSERKVLKKDRQERILVSAMKQSYKTKLPQLSELEKFKQFVKRDFDGRKFICHCYNDLPKKTLNESYKKGEKALLLIGPEGDFSKEEIGLAMQQGFEPIALGASRLRTETAAIVACHTIHVLNA
jgi:16S rRNA (uracil1498-N3)-methyltransferase